MKKIVMLLIWIIGSALHAESDSASLLATIQFSGSSQTKFQVGTPISFACKVKNLGVKASPAGRIWIQYQFPKQLDQMPDSQLFKTEDLELPSIPAGEQILVQFKATQTLPNLFDFIKNDWAMRQYQVVLKAEQEEYIIGFANLTFSAYYYEAPQKQIPTVVPVK